jgi:hypothetical protein
MDQRFCGRPGRPQYCGNVCIRQIFVPQEEDGHALPLRQRFQGLFDLLLKFPLENRFGHVAKFGGVPLPACKFQLFDIFAS